MFEQYRIVPKEIVRVVIATFHEVGSFCSALEEEVRRGKQMSEELQLRAPKMPDYRNVDPKILPLISNRRLEEIIDLDK